MKFQFGELINIEMVLNTLKYGTDVEIHFEERPYSPLEMITLARLIELQDEVITPIAREQYKNTGNCQTGTLKLYYRQHEVRF